MFLKKIDMNSSSETNHEYKRNDLLPLTGKPHFFGTLFYCVNIEMVYARRRRTVAMMQYSWSKGLLNNLYCNLLQTCEFQ